MNLESKWWYRLFQVVYTIFLVFSLLIAFFFAAGSRPIHYEDSDETYLNCFNGSKIKIDRKGYFDDQYVSEYDTVLSRLLCAYPITEWAKVGKEFRKEYPPVIAKSFGALEYITRMDNDSFVGARLATDLIIRKNVDKQNIADWEMAAIEEIKHLPNYVSVEILGKEIREIPEKNYTIETVPYIKGSWSAFLKEFTTAALIVAIIFWIIRKIFLYIVCGKKFI